MTYSGPLGIRVGSNASLHCPSSSSQEITYHLDDLISLLHMTQVASVLNCYPPDLGDMPEERFDANVLGFIL